MPIAGSQIILCNLPIRFDNYKGCTHGCKYCFTQAKNKTMNKATLHEGHESLLSFIRGNRNGTTNWCDWNIPLHWGGLSDPFQPIEKEIKNSLGCLKIFAKSHYPFVVSTKGTGILKTYADILKDTNNVLQISMLCSAYDKLEPLAPKFAERLKDAAILSRSTRRLIVRLQPYIISYHKDIMDNLIRFKSAGVYGIAVEGIKLKKGQAGFVRLGGDMVYPLDILKPHIEEIKAAAHAAGLKFFCAENRLRYLGDSLTCCGCEGLDGFEVFKANLNSYLFDKKNYKFTEKMKALNTGSCFRTLGQTKILYDVVSQNSLKYIMNIACKSKSCLKIFRGE